MKRSTFSVAFYVRKTRINKPGESPISVRVTVDGVRADTVAKKMVKPQLWDTARGKAVEHTAYTKELNMYLDSLRAKFIRIHRDMEQDGEEYITAQAIVNRYLGRDKPERHTLLEVFREHNEKCRALSGIDMAPATVERYETSLKHTREFIQHTYNRDDIYLDELDRQFIEDYEFYLKTVRKCAHNTTTKYLKNFKRIIHVALNKEWLKKDPFQGIRFSLQPVKRDFLEKHEIEKMYRKEISIERLSQVRDIFIFCCFTGLAFTDVKQLGPEHISTDLNGNKWIRKARQKTKNVCHIPLMDIPVTIIEKYKDYPHFQEKGALLPVLCNQKMNAYIKEIATICGINKNLSTHCARHTFATLMLAHGVTIDNVAKMLGHSDTKMTRHYAKVLDSSIMRDMQQVQKQIVF